MALSNSRNYPTPRTILRSASDQPTPSRSARSLTILSVSPSTPRCPRRAPARPGGRPPGRGVGRRLVEWLMGTAACAGLAQVRLELRSRNEEARQFYEAMSRAEEEAA